MMGMTFKFEGLVRKGTANVEFAVYASDVREAVKKVWALLDVEGEKVTFTEVTEEGMW